jgi:hypothetical protein
MKNELCARILEMTLAAFGASACAGATQATEPAKVPAAAEVSKPAASGHGESRCSAAGCGAKADDTPSTAPKAADADSTNAAAMEPDAHAAPPVAVKSETTADVTQQADTATGPAPKAKHKKHGAKKKSGDEEGCGAGSCASA